MTAKRTVKRPSTRARARARARRGFLAIDGEAVTERGEHRYVLLNASDGKGYSDALVDKRGIGTRDAFNWLLKLSRSQRAIFVAFGLGYDVNMILRDLEREQIEELWKMGEIHVELAGRWYWLEHVPGKLFGVSTDGASFTVYDVFGFFQTSFVKALDAWAVATPAIVERMKQERHDFTLANLNEIHDYNAEECRLLVELMDAVRAALDAVELKPRSWLGAGAIASALLTKHNVHTKIANRRPLSIDEDILPRAYFGGRTEMFRQGLFPHAASWDINSAYPFEATLLPSMLGTWRRARRYDPLEPWAIWRVKWNIKRGELVAPFPFRDKRAIYYPLTGEGYYHAIEVEAARALYGERIAITSGYVFTPDDPDDRPFAFLHDAYAHRRELKRRKHPGEKVLKLGINSVYGKLAQGTTRRGRPRFQEYFWSGRITAGTRARVLTAAAAARNGVVAIATDGIMFAGDEPEHDTGTGLGAWERTGYVDLFVAQPGMYHAREANGRRVVKHSRGFFTKEIDFTKLRRAWRARGQYASLECASTRFVGMGTALVRKDFAIWRTWESSTRTIRLHSNRKLYDDVETLAGGAVRTLHPPVTLRDGLSHRYVPKGAAVELDDVEYVQGLEQPSVAS